MKTSYLIVLACLPLTGCFELNTAQSPLATSFPVSNQQKMQSAQHWSVLANHQAELLAKNSELEGQPMFIDSRKSRSKFSRSYKSLLTSALINNGVIVSTTPLGAANITYDVSLVEHSDRDPNRMPLGYWTALTAGVWVASEVTSPVVGTLAAAAGVDAFSGNSINADTDHEVIITTQVALNERISYSSSNVYYVNNGDTGNYSSRDITLTDKL